LQPYVFEYYGFDVLISFGAIAGEGTFFSSARPVRTSVACLRVFDKTSCGMAMFLAALERSHKGTFSERIRFIAFRAILDLVGEPFSTLC
jgi:hypothetical protein